MYSSDSFKLGGLKFKGPNNVVSPVFSNYIQPSPIPASFSLPQAAGYPSRKRTFDNVGSNKVLVIKTVGKLEAAASKATGNTSSVPLAETATSVKDPDPEPSLIPPQAPVLNPPYHEVSDEFWTKI